MGRREIITIVFATLLQGIAYSTAAAQTTKIHISAPSKSLSWFPIHLAREKGFNTAEGLNVDYVIMKPQVAIQALIAGDVGYTTALGSTIRAAFRNIPLRVVMTIADKPLFALIVRPGISSVEELKGKLLGISSFGASTDTFARALLRRYKLAPNQDVKIIALGGGTNASSPWKRAPSTQRSSKRRTTSCSNERDSQNFSSLVFSFPLHWPGSARE